MSKHHNSNGLQFEPNVKTIIGNFIAYINTTYNKVFAEEVLMSF
jgi:hypothetical protein